MLAIDPRVESEMLAGNLHISRGRAPQRVAYWQRMAQRARRAVRLADLLSNPALPPREVAAEMGLSLRTMYARKARLKSARI